MRPLGCDNQWNFNFSAKLVPGSGGESHHWTAKLLKPSFLTKSHSAASRTGVMWFLDSIRETMGIPDLSSRPHPSQFLSIMYRSAGNNVSCFFLKLADLDRPHMKGARPGRCSPADTWAEISFTSIKPTNICVD